MKHLVIYHNKDLDGFCSGAIINEALKLRGVSPADIELIGYDYGGPFEIPVNCAVYMADVSLPMELMVEVAKHNVSFTWIDHHKTAIDAFNALSHWQKALFTTTVLDTTLSACELCWQWSYIGEMPEAVKLLGEYDTWRGFGSDRWNYEVYPFQFAMRSIVTSAETFPVFYLFPHIPTALYGPEKDGLSYDADYIEKMIVSGQTILRYIETQNARLMANAHFASANIGGEYYKVLAINQAGLNSEAFKTVWNPNQFEMMMPYWFDGKKWCYSLYTTHEHIHCGEIAKKMGGGGHKEAAGFKLDEPLIL